MPVMELEAAQDEVQLSFETTSLPMEAHTIQTDIEPLAITLFTQNVKAEIRKERLPSTSIHVLEKIIETQEGNYVVGTTTIPQQQLMDVMALEQTTNNQMMSNNTGNNASDKADVGITHDALVRVFPTHHKEIQVSKNVQSDLDLWARIREYDQRTTDEGFTQVLSKKQQQEVKKQVLGKSSYNTRAKGTHPPSK